MDANQLKAHRRLRRKRSIRKHVYGTPDRPRLTVFRSNAHIYAQVIDDVAGRTIAAASSLNLDKGSDAASAKAVGEALAKVAKAQGVERVTFDRSGYRYHGRIKALADAAREGGLSF